MDTYPTVTVEPVLILKLAGSQTQSRTTGHGTDDYCTEITSSKRYKLSSGKMPIYFSFLWFHLHFLLLVFLATFNFWVHISLVVLTIVAQYYH
jgi:hypothetical protein